MGAGLSRMAVALHHELSAIGVTQLLRHIHGEARALRASWRRSGAARRSQSRDGRRACAEPTSSDGAPAGSTSDLAGAREQQPRWVDRHVAEGICAAGGMATVRERPVLVGPISPVLESDRSIAHSSPVMSSRRMANSSPGRKPT